MMKKRILALHAHPDDVEILAGGTMALLAAAGHDLTVVTMTPGDCGSADKSPEEIAAIRRSEAAAAATRLGARYFCAEFRDLRVFSDDHSRQRVTEILRRTRPEIILTASPVDYMADHESTSQLVRDACFAAPAPNYSTRDLEPSPPLPAIPHLYFMDPIGGRDRNNAPVPAEFYVSVGSKMALKRAMLGEHHSQRDWLQRHHGMDNYIEQMEEWTRERGALCGVEFAEGFRQYIGHPYPASPLLQELLGANVISA